MKTFRSMTFFLMLFCFFATGFTLADATASDCDFLTCMLSGGTCVNNVCVKPNATPTPTPVPTPTQTPSGCDAVTCMLSGGTCVNGVCVIPTASPTPTPVPTPTPTPVPTPTPGTLSFIAKPFSQLVTEIKTCTNIDMNNMVPILMTNQPPSGNVKFYSALMLYGVQFYAENDILGRVFFGFHEEGDKIKSHDLGPYPAHGVWMDTVFMSGLFSALPGLPCSFVADLGVVFLFGYAPVDDFSKFQGATFTFVRP